MTDIPGLEIFVAWTLASIISSKITSISTSLNEPELLDNTATSGVALKDSIPDEIIPWKEKEWQECANSEITCMKWKCNTINGEAVKKKKKSK